MRADWTVPDGFYAVMSFSSRSITLGFPDTTRRYQLQSGLFSLTSQLPGNYAIIWVKNKKYDPANLVKGSVQLTRLDRQAGIVSGTFEFIIVGDPGDTLRVTNGRFDIGNMDR
jgi:hypothetical protein